jgi:hypothetical protein
MSEKKVGSVYIRMLVIVICGFFLNLLWEVLHSLLYDWNKEPLINDIYVYIPRIVFFASGFDAFWILTITLLTTLMHRSFEWLYSPKKSDYAIFFCIGLVIAIFIEIQATFLNQWSYNEYMPVLFGIGLTPFLQLGTTSCISLYVSTRIAY